MTNEELNDEICVHLSVLMPKTLVLLETLANTIDSLNEAISRLIEADNKSKEALRGRQR